MGVKVEMGAKSGEQIMQNWPWNKNCCQCPAYQILPSEASFDEDNEDGVDDEEDNDSHGDDETGDNFEDYPEGVDEENAVWDGCRTDGYKRD